MGTLPDALEALVEGAIDRFKMLKNPLPLPGPDMPKIWKKINKCIDQLHLKNHKNKLCQVKYNPSKVKEDFPEANLMVCEQTFAWLGRFKKILNSTPKTHSHFLLHRLVLARTGTQSTATRRTGNLCCLPPKLLGLANKKKY